MNMLIGYFMAVNIIAVWVMHIDKKRAVKRKYRIPEKRLWMIALVGGAIGCTFGMLLFRHKTKRWSFRLGFPLLAVLQTALLVRLWLVTG